ncbi:MAG: D-aminoacyl-tRNA deacylase [Lachnospiraceae bacterium]|nr:D-aminoacyl-tRNA deacylase [Lachnospiraceae bacterium]
MRFVIQRVTRASVTIDNEVTGQIGKGFLVLVGVENSDNEQIADKMVKKLCGLRIFEDGNGKTNLDISAVEGSLLVVSQFTLYADCHHGNRPSFINAGRPELAEPLYEHITKECRKYVPNVQTGRFGADMKVELINDGPFTIVLDSKEIC